LRRQSQSLLWSRNFLGFRQGLQKHGK
jgi:hypothetical protein